MDNDDKPLDIFMNELVRFVGVAAVIAALIMVIAFVGPEASAYIKGH